MTLDAFLARFANVRPLTAGRWSARCPAHEDRSQDTLSLAVGADGRRLLYCWAGCRTEDVLQRSGASWRDCFEDDGPRHPPRPLTYTERVQREARTLVRERDRRYGPWRDYWALCDLIREEQKLAATLRTLVLMPHHDEETVWGLLGWAAEVELDALRHEAEADADLEARRAQP